MISIRRSGAMAAIVTATAGLLAGSGIWTTAASADSTYLGGLMQNNSVASTVPTSNGDVNPYGVAVVPRSTGDLVQGDVLVSNFNNKITTASPTGQQGLGTTIMQVSPSGGVTQFAGINGHVAGCPGGGVGLTTALVVLRSGWVIVGSLPTIRGNPATSKAGCLIVLNDRGKPVETISGDLINGPWDMTAFDGGTFAVLFVTNVLNGTVGAGGATVFQGTVV